MLIYFLLFLFSFHSKSIFAFNIYADSTYYLNDSDGSQFKPFREFQQILTLFDNKEPINILIINYLSLDNEFIIKDQNKTIHFK